VQGYQTGGMYGDSHPLAASPYAERLEQTAQPATAHPVLQPSSHEAMSPFSLPTPSGQTPPASGDSSDTVTQLLSISVTQFNPSGGGGVEVESALPRDAQ
jgi:hypothetical protein